jgi:hypothetical protein
MAGAYKYRPQYTQNTLGATPGEEATMTRDEALAIVNGPTLATYADTGECPLCKRKSVGGQYPHNMDCPFVVATKIVEGS